jgi:hypothetical protein
MFPVGQIRRDHPRPPKEKFADSGPNGTFPDIGPIHGNPPPKNWENMGKTVKSNSPRV